MKGKVLGVLSAIVLGALGSGLWELIKPTFSIVGDSLVTATSLGIKSLIDDIYVRVGQADRGVIVTKASLLFTLTVMSLSFAIALLFRRIRRTSLIEADTPTHRSVNWEMPAIAALLMFGAFNATGSIRHMEVSDLRAHYDYLRRASAPYFSEDEKAKIDSRLALVTSKEEFETISGELKQRLRSNKIIFKER